jgi:hypothetical protein
MKIFRIKQTGEDKFIPQIANGIVDWLFGDWDGIEIDENGVWYVWPSKEYQDVFCVTDSLEKAKEVIENYKKRFNSEKGYPKYHKA